jgi:hypothetical protein
MSDNNNQQHQKPDEYGGRGCIQMLMLAAFSWGALMMFPKTVDLLTNFAPERIAGYTDMQVWWAVGSALLIEGVMVVMKIKSWLYPARNVLEWAWDAILSFAPFIISALCQVFDSLLVNDILTEQPAEIQYLVVWGVPALPALIVGIMMIYGLVESAPAGLFGGLQTHGKGWQMPKVQVPGWLRNWWNGNENGGKRISPNSNQQQQKPKQEQKPPQEDKQRREDPTQAERSR